MKGNHWKIRNGKTIRFWLDSWIYGIGPLANLDTFKDKATNECKLEEYLTDDKKWDMDKLNVGVGPQLAQQITYFPIPSNDIEDDMC